MTLSASSGFRTGGALKLAVKGPGTVSIGFRTRGTLTMPASLGFRTGGDLILAASLRFRAGGILTLPASFEFRTGGGAACIPEATPAFVKRGSQGPCAGLLTGGAGTALEGRRGAGDAVTAGALPSRSTITCWGWEPPDSLIGSEVWEATPAVGVGGCEGPGGVPAGVLVAGEGGGGAVLPGGA